jgi:glucose/arabinose dehydrogenase
VLVTSAGDGSGRLYVVEQTGRILTMNHAGEVAARPFLDVGDLIVAGGEQGLLGLAFDPRFGDDGRFFINYTNTDGDTVIAAYRADQPTVADPASAHIITTIPQPYPNHNGGNLAFGPDGALYVGMGDGGSEGDPQDRGQEPTTPLGKMLRIDVGVKPPKVQIWGLGLRNPWRFSFDRRTGDLWIGDVGQSTWEEIDHTHPGTRRGVNYGWNVMEGRACYEPPEGCDRGGKHLPAAVYGHSQGCAVTGGYVYRGNAIPGLRGTYLFGDYCSGTIWGIPATSHTARPRVLLQTGLSISSFGEDDAGDVYVVDHRGTIYALRA